MMTLEERAAVLSATQKTVGGKLPFMVGCGAIDPNIVVSYCHQAIEYGATAALIATPYYVKPTPLGLVRHYSHVAAAVPDLPIILYNVPGRTGVDMTASTAARITAACPPGSIIGCKEATGEVSRVAHYREKLGPDFLLWGGDDAAGAEFVLGGGDGVISVTANVAPRAMRAVMDAAREGNRELTTSLNAPLMDLHNDIFIQPNPIPCKHALWRMGMIENGVRTPLHPLEEEHWEVLERAMGKAGIELI